MSEVKRFNRSGDERQADHPDVCFVLASDYDALQQKCREAEADRDESIYDGSALLMKFDSIESERDALRALVDAMRKDAERYRFVRELAWYVDQAAYVYEVGNSRSPWSGERSAVDADDIEKAIDAAMEARE